MTTINFFNYTGSGNVTRKTTVINGVPFYCSSGINSKCAETWFPFLGLDLEGWFRKPGFMQELPNLDDTIPKKIHQYFPNEEIRKRFASLKCLLISSALGGGFWETEDGNKLSQKLITLHPDFYDNNMYDIEDSHFAFDTQNKPTHSSEVRKIIRQVNDLLKKGTVHSLSTGFTASLFENNLVNTQFGHEALCPIPKNTSIVSKPQYPEFPKTLTPTCYEKLIWPTDFEQSLHLTEEQRKETEQFIKTVYPGTLKHIKTNKLYLDYSLVAGQELGTSCMSNNIAITTHLNIKFLHNGEIIVYPDNVDFIYKSTSKNTNIFKIYNLSRGEWGVLKNEGRKDFIPYLKLLNDEPHITKIYDFTKYNNELSHVGKLYHQNLLELINEKSLSTAQKKKFMCSLLQGLNAIHQIPYQFNRTAGHLFHADIKLHNIYYDAQKDDVVIGDHDSSGIWNNIYSSPGYISPELALCLLKVNCYNDQGFCSNITGFNKENGQHIDIWNLGIIFVALLQGKQVNHEFWSKNVTYANLNFILDRIQSPDERVILLAETANLKQEEVDEELCQIKQELPATAEGQTLRHLWDIVHQMLQVSTSARLSCSELLHKIQETQSVLSEKAFAGLRKNSIFSVSNTIVSNATPSAVTGCFI